MLEQLIDIDRQLLLTLNGWNSPFFDVFMWLVSSTSIWIPFFVMVLYVMFKNKQREAILALLMIAITITLTDQIASSVFKPMFERFRPSHDPLIASLVHTVNDYRGGSFGFVSSHASNTFGFALFTSLMFRHRLYTIVSFLFALLSSYSRIYLGVHFVGDILCGMAVGLICASLTFALYMYLQKGVLNFRTFFTNQNFTSTGYCKKDMVILSQTFIITIIFIVLVCVRM